MYYLTLKQDQSSKLTLKYEKCQNEFPSVTVNFYLKERMFRFKHKIIFIFLSLASCQLLACPNCNVVFIAIDALQAKRISSLGYSRETTPKIDRLAAEGVFFSQAYSPSSWTIPTFLSVFSSTYPTEHTMTNRYRKFEKDEKIVSNFAKDTPKLQVMAEIFRQKAYRTGAFTGASGVSAELGYNKGFEVFKDDVAFGGIENSAKSAIEWLKALKKEEKFFLFLHGYDTHGQYSLPQDYNGKFMIKSKKFKGTKEEEIVLREAKVEGKSTNIDYSDKEFWSAWYDSKIFDADHRLGRFLSDFQKMPQAKNTIIVLISDHGTEIFEHDSIDHGHTLYDELVHVPFIMTGPGIKKNNMVKEQVTTMDLLPTLLDYLSIKPTKTLKAQMRGRSLKKALLGKPIAAADAFSETDYRDLIHKRSVRTKDNWKLIITLDDGSEELYDLNTDPSEKKNLSSSNPKKANAMMSTLDKHLNSMSQAKNKYK